MRSTLLKLYLGVHTWEPHFWAAGKSSSRGCGSYIGSRILKAWKVILEAIVLCCHSSYYGMGWDDMKEPFES